MCKAGLAFIWLFKKEQNGIRPRDVLYHKAL